MKSKQENDEDINFDYPTIITQQRNYSTDDDYYLMSTNQNDDLMTVIIYVYVHSALS